MNSTVKITSVHELQEKYAAKIPLESSYKTWEDLKKKYKNPSEPSELYDQHPIFKDVCNKTIIV